jgi:hypothetical protein
MTYSFRILLRSYKKLDLINLFFFNFHKTLKYEQILSVK